MEEFIKIYAPLKTSTTYTYEQPQYPWKKNSKWKYFNDVPVWKWVLEAKRKQEHELMAKYPWFPVMYNWLILLLVAGLLASFVYWGLDISTQRKVEAATLIARAEAEAERDAIEARKEAEIKAQLLSEDAVVNRMATTGSKAVYGIRNFIEKYGYSERDIKTYIRCMCDRVDYAIKTQLSEAEREAYTLEDIERLFTAVVEQKDQFLAYSDKNPVLNSYYKAVYEELDSWLHEETKPWDINYRFAELNDDGIWLVQNINSDGYARRVRY